MPFKAQHPLYSTWQNMRSRCRNPNNPYFRNYGGRGIAICDRWESFRAFAEDMGPRPEGHTMDRIDNDGDYTPENCRWASKRDQARNQRKTLFVEIDGERHCVQDLADRYGVAPSTITRRLKNGVPLDTDIDEARLESVKRGAKASAAKKRAATHCAKGHEYTRENTILSKEGWRRCRICYRAAANKASRRYKAKMRAAR